MTKTMRDNADEQRYELKVGSQTAYTYYELAPNVLTFAHTDVPQVLAGQGVASRLIKGALEDARARGLKVVANCPFVAAYLEKHPEFKDLMA